MNRSFRVPALVVLLLSLPLSLGAQVPDHDPNAAVRAALQAELEDFSAPGWDRRPPVWPEPARGPFVPAGGPALERYRDRLVRVSGWTGGLVWHQAGTLPLVRPGRPTEQLGVNVFLPPGTPKGTLYFVHGYMSHAANFAYTYAWYTARGWAVTTLDLPGHGMSTGTRADVATFADYGDAVGRWLDWGIAQGWPGPRMLMAHSLGSAACFEALRRPGSPRFDRVVFCAPLLRTHWYPALALVEAAVGTWMTRFPSTFGWDGYLDGYAMPVHWFHALVRWLEGLETQKPLDLPLEIYSGDRDSVVDAGWNLAEYRRLVPGVKETFLAGQDHLFLSADDTRQAFHTLVTGEADRAGQAFRWTRRETLGLDLQNGRSVDLGVSVALPPGTSRGTLLFLHGWKSHADEFPTLEAWFVDRGWTVAALDLPGHGRSGGPRAEVADFGEYGAAVRRWLAWVGDQGWPGPQVLVAHSLGAAAALEAFRDPRTPRPGQVVFCAPLVKTDWQGALALAGAITGGRASPLPEARWFAALDRWTSGLGSQPSLPLPLTVYSGDRDTVVDEGGTLAELRRLVPGLRNVVLPGKGHWFLQIPGDREEFLVRLTADLGG